PVYINPYTRPVFVKSSTLLIIKYLCLIIKSWRITCDYCSCFYKHFRTKKGEKNMKKLVFAIVAVGFSISAFAQGQPMGFGIKGGGYFPKYTFSGNNADYQTNSPPNSAVTAFLAAPIATDGFSIQPGVSLPGQRAELVNSEFGSY